jgi:hypothetical protein
VVYVDVSCEGGEWSVERQKGRQETLSAERSEQRAETNTSSREAKTSTQPKATQKNTMLANKTGNTSHHPPTYLHTHTTTPPLHTTNKTNITFIHTSTLIK